MEGSNIIRGGTTYRKWLWSERDHIQKVGVIWMGQPWIMLSVGKGWQGPRDWDKYVSLNVVRCGLSVRIYLPCIRSFICWAYSNFCQYKPGLWKPECLCSLALYLSLIVPGRTNLFLLIIFIFLSFKFTILYSCHFIYNFVNTKRLILVRSAQQWYALGPLVEALLSFFFFNLGHWKLFFAQLQ